MINCLTKLGAIAASATLLIHSALAADNAEVMTWKVDGQTRRAIVYPPTAISGGKAPLVLSFHGRGDNIQNFQFTNMHLAWPEAIVVYFQGLPTRGGLFGWQTEKGQDDDRDLELVDVALASLRDHFKVDEARIYSTGFSNGAGFTYLLWAERPTVFAAFAPVAGRLRPSVQPKEPRAVFHVAGIADETVPFASQQEAIDVAKRVDGATGEGIACGKGCTTYRSPGGPPVMTWFHPGGHVYPSDTSARIAKFFRDHHK
jgi:polyhydroxybutyrate depolymerase